MKIYPHHEKVSKAEREGDSVIGLHAKTYAYTDRGVGIYHRPTTPNLKEELNGQFADCYLTIYVNNNRTNSGKEICTIKLTR